MRSSAYRFAFRTVLLLGAAACFGCSQQVEELRQYQEGKAQLALPEGDAAAVAAPTPAAPEPVTDETAAG
jgi:hypothetical protein